ncbi:hypothetical protein K0B03_01810 [Patescibacteria group bacterium]|nr:hypothetical protein [Patescibacteria group bacterium]
MKDIESLFELLSVKMKSGGKFISTIGSLNSELRSYSTNARYLYNGQQFPDNKKRELKDGDSFVIKFYKVSGEKYSGYLEGAEATEYYHSAEKIKKLAKAFGFDVFISEWQDIIKVKNTEEEINLDVFVLTRN